MTFEQLEERVLTLERELAEIKTLLLTEGPRKKDWRRTVGMFANDPEFDEILRLGREWRERENKQEME